MKKLTANEIRKTWLEFFKSKGHDVEPGASLIPHNDPTLLWINSGVAALKKYFDGSDMPKNKRITNVQKSIRTNDIENVGHTARHHTFFEMLGNFSIGDYFRKEAIQFAHEILTSDKYFGMPEDKLYFTYLPTDLETKKFWLAEGVAEDHLIPLEGNFWQIGEGPCGPNTEVFFDRGEKYDPEHIGIKLLRDDMENDRYIEIWGIVFSQYNAVEGVKRENYKELPSKNIDTGAGLERIACVLQETPTNFETDLFMPIIKATEKLAKIPYGEGNYMPYRVIADHVRTCAFALSDGATFSNEGRGYVLRRILRRAMRYGRKIGINEPFLYKLVAVVAKMMHEYYPYLTGKVDVVSKMILSEEEKFMRTLTSGETILRKLIENKTVLEGPDAFKLYDTYGFPVELTVEIAAESHVKVDLKGFEEEMTKQKERARQARSTLQSMNKQAKDLMAFTAKSSFTYENGDITAKVIGLFINGAKVSELDEEGEVILDNTNFYAESGGQVADHGDMINATTSLEVTDVQKAPNKQHLHHVIVRFGKVHVGDVFTLKIDPQKRLLTMRNHSSAHLLQRALIEVLGEHIHQQGSFVNEDYVRFDFSHNEKVKEADLREIEKKVNEYINQAIPELTQVLPIAEAKKTGAISLFDEKYGDVVRVVCFGDISREFCGGTHVKNSLDIGVFAIEFEESIAAGIRRIQARTGLHAYELLKHKEALLGMTRDLVGSTSIFEVNDRVKSLLAERDELHKENKTLLDKQASLIGKSLKEEFSTFNGYRILTKFIPGTSRETLMKLVDSLKGIYPDTVIVLIGEDKETLPIVVAVTGIAIKDGVKAGLLVKELASQLGGSGGGRPELASGSGRDKSKVSEALENIKGMLH